MMSEEARVALAFARALRRPLADLPEALPMLPLRAPFRVEMTPPGSKSLTNRALLLAALADGESTLRGPLLDADDAKRMIDALRVLGAEITEAPQEDGPPGLRVRGAGGALRGDVSLDLGNAGTATRFLAAATLLAQGPVAIDGDARMRQRPIGQLAGALRSLGATVEFLQEDGCPPLRITPPAAMRESVVTLPTTASSQFISALLLVAPWLPNGVTIEIEGEVTSRSYIVMTLELLRRLGAHDVSASDDLRALRVGPGPLAPFTLDIEPDASGATYFWAAAALCPGSSVRITGLGRESVQGDARFPSVLAAMGAAVGRSDDATSVAAPEGESLLHGVSVDCSTMPDAALTLAVVASLAQSRSELSGLRTLRVKETDRLAALQTELSKIGATIDVVSARGDEALVIHPPRGGVDCSGEAEPIAFDTYDDHRMAMSLALVGLRRPGVLINDPACVAKTYPTFWADLARLYESAAGR